MKMKKMGNILSMMNLDKKENLRGNCNPSYSSNCNLSYSSNCNPSYSSNCNLINRMDRGDRGNSGSSNSIMINIIYLISLGLFILLSISMVSAIGIAPGRTSMDLSANLQSISSDVAFTVYNTEHKEMDVAFVVEGDLKDYITISNANVHLSASEGERGFSYHVNLPKDLLLDPGLHKAEIVAIDLPKDAKDQGTFIRASVSVVTQLFVYVLYSGKRIEAEINVLEKEDGNVYFFMPLYSRGNETIERVTGNIIIYDSSGKEVDRLYTNELSLEPADKKELTSVWENPLNGRFMAELVLDYDGAEKTIKKEFSVGSDISILSVSAKDFVLGDIAKITILIQNKMGSEIIGAVAHMDIYDNKLEKIKELNSESYSLNSNSNSEMVIYWDTDGLSEGLFETDLRIDYDKRFLEQRYRVDVDKNMMIFSGVGFVIADESPSGFSVMTVLYIVIGVLILINLLWLISWIRAKKKKKK